MLKIRIVADYNDADYIEETNTITEEKLEEFKPLIKAIKLKNNRFPTGEIAGKNDNIKILYPDIDENILEDFSCYVPYGEYGIHSIEHIYISENVPETDILKET